MALDLDFNLQIVVCPIVREDDGLAMSSRNVRLSEEQRAAAPILYKALTRAHDKIAAGQTDGDALRSAMRDLIRNEPLARLDYVSVADPETLEELAVVRNRALLSGAVYFGDIRLIDNIVVVE
jgi:pantoate--beta-alanine ligase